jgi:hypothetical protein
VLAVVSLEAERVVCILDLRSCGRLA